MSIFSSLRYLTDPVISAASKTVSHLLGDHHDWRTLSDEDVSKIFEHNSLSDMLFFEDYDPVHQLYFNRSSVGFVFELPMIMGGNDKDIKQINSIFENILNPKLKPSLQFLMIATDKIDHLFDVWRGELSKLQDN